MSTTPQLPGFEHLTLPGGAPGEPRTTRRGPSAEELLEGLNGPQRDAVMHAGPPLLVVAGAGSGKTRVLTRRIAWLISERKAHPGSILAITFTNKAAAEMKERVSDLIGNRARIMWVSTFHSACVRILRKEAEHLGYERLKSNFSIHDAQDQKRLITLVCNDLDLDPRKFQPGPRDRGLGDGSGREVRGRGTSLTGLKRQARDLPEPHAVESRKHLVADRGNGHSCWCRGASRWIAISAVTRLISTNRTPHSEQ